MSQMRNKLVTIAAIGAAGLGGAALANAATSGSSTTTTPSAPPAQQGYGAPSGGPGGGFDPSRGGHQANGKTETLLTGDTAAKVKAAALAKVSGGTVERVETDADHGSPYEAHVTKSDGTQVEVLVDKDFKVTAVNAMPGRP